jgi:hypothetical protein
VVEMRVKSVGQLERESGTESGNVVAKYQVVLAGGVGVAWGKDESF